MSWRGDDWENPNLKVGKMYEQDGQLEVEMVTKKEGALVKRMVIEKKNGWRCRFY